MAWGISVTEPSDAYDGLSEDDGIDKQNRALEITEEVAEDLNQALRDELGGRWQVKVYV